MIWTPERIAAAQTEAHRWHGTPHRDRMALPGIGIDCINYVYEILIAAQILERAPLGYYNTRVGLHDGNDRLKRAFKECATVLEQPASDPQFGDIVIFKTGAFSGHCGIVLTGGDIWHSLAGRTVTRSNFAEWIPKIDCLLRIEQEGLIGVPMEAAKKI